MKKRYIIAISLALVCLFTQNALFAQENDSTAVRYLKKYTITGQPTSMLNGAFRVDFEQRIEGRHWYRIAPTIYIYPSVYDDWYWYDFEGGDSPYYTDYYSDWLVGAGIDLGYKYFIDKWEICYALGGVHYSFVNVQYEYQDFVPFYEEDGTPYYRWGTMSEQQNFNRIGAIACIGVQTPQRKGFFIDTYIGIGYRYAFYDEQKPAFDSDIWGYGYRGFHVTGGFRIGIAFGSYPMKNGQ